MEEGNNNKSSDYEYLAKWVRGRACNPCRSKSPSSIDSRLHKACLRCEMLADWLQGNPIVERTLYDLAMWVESKKQQKSEWLEISRILSVACREFVNSDDVEDEIYLPEVEINESLLDNENENKLNGFDTHFQDEWL